VKAPAPLKPEYLALKRAYSSLFSSPDAEKVMEDLYYRFNRSTMRTVEHKVDVHASIAAAGAREVLLYIELMMRDKDVT
jgi:hypothetical protein